MTRFRPVLMTALAMIIGMLPMALGLGEGGEQNAPLGRAVIGGLIFATVATLLFVPVVFSLVHRRHRRRANPMELQPSSCLERTRPDEASGPDDRTLKRVGIGAGVVALRGRRRRHRRAHRATNAPARHGRGRSRCRPSPSSSRRPAPARRRAASCPATCRRYNSAADLRPHQRLCPALARRYRRPGPRRPARWRSSTRPRSTSSSPQARPIYQTALANQKLAGTTATRWNAMLAKDAVSQQEADEKAGDLAAKTALANAALANVAAAAGAAGLHPPGRARSTAS